MKLILSTCLTLACTSALSFAGEVHNADFVPTVQNGQIVVGAINPDTNDVEYPSRIKSAILGTEGFPNFTNDPGFNSELGALIPGMTIGFNILQAPRVWDPIDEDFETIASEQITVRAAGQNILAPSTDTVVPGIIFGQASFDPSASFHHHMQYLLNGGLPPMIEGVWMLEIELWSENSSVDNSDPIYLVFGQGEGEAQISDAISWIETNLIASPCLAEMSGDDSLNFLDVSAFLASFAAQDSRGDFNSDGQFNFLDISAFLAAFSAGCP
ncbi:MAG: GC-type dockerin domain-anchored protein [Phycisphaerales bacterium]